MEYLKAFLCGGVLCVIGQVLIDKTPLTPAKILVSYVTAGVILSGVGVYQYLADWGGAGATVPLTGFGHLLAKGVKKAVAEDGLLGALHRRRRRNHRRHLLRLPGGPPLQAQVQSMKRA